MRAVYVGVVAVLAAGCDEGPEPGVPLHSLQRAEPEACSVPETPRIHRDLHRVERDGFTAPHIPPHRTSADGRVALNTQGSGFELRFWLFVPEALHAPILHDEGDRPIHPDPEPWVLPFQPADHDYTGHHAICDPRGYDPSPGERPNPYACGEGHDCYDLVVISNTVRGLDAQFWGLPVTLEVADPKTSAARLVDVRAGDPVAGPWLRGSPEWSESMVTFDGRLLTGRAGSLPRNWTHPQTGEVRTGLYDLMYAVLPDEAEPCDVTAWTDFHPMSHAPFDPQMKGRYALADYPFRDTEGRQIDDGEDLAGTYPWVDRLGRNVFMSAIPDTLAETPEDAFPRRCHEPGCEGFREATGTQKGYLVGGGWTHGRFVHLDAMINHTDWPVGGHPSNHVVVDLYGPGPVAGPTSVRVGAGRMGVGEPGMPVGFGGNLNILDSAEHLYNFRRHLRPGTPRDVVWVMSTGAATDEVVFDDMLDPDALIVSNMQASITAMDIPIPPKVVYWNGLDRSQRPARFTGEIHVQNGATSLPERWAAPAYGELAPGAGRIEPVAMGGIRGKGLWLDGSAGVRYRIPDQPQPIDDHDWYMGVFVDARRAEASVRTLVSFPDGSRLSLHDDRELVMSKDDLIVHRVWLPEPSLAGWMHIGMNLRDGFRRIELFHDGFLLAHLRADEPLFQPVPGSLWLGDDPSDPWSGVCGWVDDFKLIARAVDPEVACNHAYGTLAGVEPGHPLHTAAAAYPELGHEVLRHLLRGVGWPVSDRYVCLHDHTSDAGVLHGLPEDALHVRDALIFPEGPVRYGQARPDSSDNAFCLSCHTSEGRSGLGLGALAPIPGLLAEDDPRRQPDQPPARVFGQIPAGWIPAGPGEGSPGEAQALDELGASLDAWVLPR